MAPTLTIPDSLNEVHAALLRELHFETAGDLGRVVRSDAYDGLRAIYAITDPARTEVVYVGESEEGRNLRARLRAHLEARSKAGHVEHDSLAFVHVMVTEFMVLCRFEDELGQLPRLNRRKTPKHPTSRGGHFAYRNGANEARSYRKAEAERKSTKGGGHMVTLLNPSKPPDAKRKSRAKKRRKPPKPRKVTLLT